MAKSKPITAKPQSKHHYLRTPIASLLGSLATVLIILSVVVLWLGRTLTDTNTYVSTVAPLVSDNDIQFFTVDKVSEALLDTDDGRVQGIASELLGPQQVQSKTVDQLREDVRPKVENILQTVVTSSEFAKLWEDTNRLTHETLIQQLNSNSSTVNVDFGPLFDGVISQLENTELSFVQGNVDFKPEITTVSIKSDNFENLRNSYGKVKQAVLILILLSLVMTILAVVVSVHHVKTLRRVALATGIFAGLIAIGLSATSLIQFSGSDSSQQKLILAIVGGVTQSLQLTLLVIAAVGIGGAIASKLYEVWSFRQKL